MASKKLLSNLSEEDLKELYIIDMFRTYELNRMFLEDLDGATNRRKILQLKSFIEEQMKNIKLDLADNMISNDLEEVEFFNHKIKVKIDKENGETEENATVSFELIPYEVDEKVEKEINEEEQKYLAWETRIKNNIIDAVNNHYTNSAENYTFLQLCDELSEDTWEEDTSKFDIISKLQDLSHNGVLKVDGNIFSSEELNKCDGTKILDYSTTNESSINPNFVIKLIK
ncbi:hypothetical protein [Methanococcus voltae]|uniref:Uncharacterized protein n=1 Tax=Methanococcus voltae TaxID=2188 RepID=A0A8J7S0N4_METVO|nr:hypothetical protein [Methanococcus voltae]MBP2173210.1 hypothetical protein [Methanococcus voltae]MBP2201230.1 hypothetical protein [Methanococcus voltae]